METSSEEGDEWHDDQLKQDERDEKVRVACRHWLHAQLNSFQCGIARGDVVCHHMTQRHSDFSWVLQVLGAQGIVTGGHTHFNVSPQEHTSSWCAVGP